MYKLLKNQPVTRPVTFVEQLDKKDEDGFLGKLGEVYGLEHDAIKVGVGKTNNHAARLEAGFKLGKSLAQKGIETVTYQPEQKEDLAFVEGLLRAFYRFDKYKETEETVTLNLNIVSEDEALLTALDQLDIINQGVNFARDIVNEPANTIYPESLAELTQARLSVHGVEVDVLNQTQIEDLKMEAFLAVARGSVKEPKVLVMKWLPKPESKEILGLVGKGVTYDSGGYSLKPSASMKTMFCDMGGAGTVIATMETIARLNLQTNVIAVVAATENMISGNSYKPGDIIGSMAGKTIEIDNTDAEGRLTLADALYYITKKHAVTKVVDLATLTGACLVALGETYTGAVTNNPEFMQEMMTAAQSVDEYIWELPNSPAFAKMNKSDVADIKNSGGRLGGTISAGLFVGEFLADEIPWVHLDIAGTAYLSSNSGYLTKGATGVHVKTLVEYIQKSV